MPHPGVRFPPPLLFVTAFIIGWLVDTRVGRLPLIGTGSAPLSVQVIASLAVVAGFALIAWGMLTFARAKTAIIPFRPASHLVETGPYRFTRNPMYTGFTIVYAGLAWALNTGWPLLLLPFVLVALYVLVIKREERYLLSAFGPDYESYRQRVRRWF
jgi:protein-S-isoprenylcysteine O-methyltransferase Ste14